MAKAKGDIELDIMCCLLLKPELMKKIRVEDKHFVKHKRLWIFMENFYNRFKTFDISLMNSVCKDKYQLLTSIEMLLDREPTAINFERYQDLLIQQYSENRYEKWVILNICDLSDKLYLGEVKVSEYVSKVAKIYMQADEIFKEDKNDIL